MLIVILPITLVATPTTSRHVWPTLCARGTAIVRAATLPLILVDQSRTMRHVFPRLPTVNGTLIAAVPTTTAVLNAPTA